MNRVLRVFLGVIVLLVATTNAWAQATAQINGTSRIRAVASCLA